MFVGRWERGFALDVTAAMSEPVSAVTSNIYMNTTAVPAKKRSRVPRVSRPCQIEIATTSAFPVCYGER